MEYLSLVSLIGVISMSRCYTPEPEKLINIEDCGLPSEETEFPWIVFLMYKDKRYCLGTLISKRHVLTAGFCKRPIRDILVLYRDGYRSPVKSGHRAPGFDKGENDDGKTFRDAWILTLPEDLVIDPKVRPICISEQLPSPRGSAVVLAGYRYDERLPRLKRSMGRILGPSDSKCEELLGGNSSSKICISKIFAGICKGDYGGPAMRIVNGVFYQVGIISYGNIGSGAPEAACSSVEERHVLTDVATLSHFIKSIVQKC
ncbi:serine protease 41-like [Galendromus occidentalis]|uniref:Serine protease 41-like n=1 Tax=Galendromus occidentalis TaxID=34638 RepID=A0AAJ6QV91_9ACAR|nr:serine protease 41-like [Galendromus occidentalis]